MQQTADVERMTPQTARLWYTNQFRAGEHETTLSSPDRLRMMSLSHEAITDVLATRVGSVLLKRARLQTLFTELKVSSELRSDPVVLQLFEFVTRQSAATL